MKSILAVLVATSLTGCAATKQEMEHELALMDRQVASSNRTPMPILSIEGIDGQPIVMSGIKHIRVYDKSANPEPVAMPARRTGAEVAWDGTAKVLGILASPVTAWAINRDNQATSRAQISANVETQRINMGSVTTISTEGFKSITGVSSQSISTAADLYGN